MAYKLRIGIIGMGNMGLAIAKSLLKKYKIYYYEINEEKVSYIKKNYPVLKFLNLAQLVDASEIIILAVKPQDMDKLLSQIGKIIKKQKLFISIAAGISIRFIEERLKEQKIIRVMPNMGALVRSAICAISKGSKVTNDDLRRAKQIFSNLGKVIFMDEEKINAVTAISGSGPGYFSYLLEAIKKSSLKIGLNEKESRELILETLKATFNLIKKLNIDYEELIGRVASKGGTTEACLKKWEEANLPQIIQNGIESAYKRAEELCR